ncbi:hypothetical protein AGDE_05940 [Angomonas deanei]|nr:hypothetical protein AGDE_05940 [Angomonas deanei]|eukprot:EPY37993.1 hypothetical protein AGDE_05940 [Angomonas deanei]
MPEKCIPITKVQIGHVVGKGGATIKELQEKTGAKIEIIDGPQVKITADDDAKLKAAEEEIKKIVANQENPDYEGPEGARLRKEANELGDKRGKLFDEATAKRNAGDHDASNKLVAEAKAAGEQMEAKHKEAARAIAKYNNEDKGKGEDYFDMHGLREEEAMDLLKERIAVLEAKPTGTVTDFEVIPGAGHHSAPGQQKLKGATEDYIKEKGYPYEEASAGSFLVKVPGGGEGTAADAAAAGAAAVPVEVAEGEEAAGDADKEEAAEEEEKQETPKDDEPAEEAAEEPEAEEEQKEEAEEKEEQEEKEEEENKEATEEQEEEEKDAPEEEQQEAEDVPVDDAEEPEEQKEEAGEAEEADKEDDNAEPKEDEEKPENTEDVKLDDVTEAKVFIAMPPEVQERCSQSRAQSQPAAQNDDEHIDDSEIQSRVAVRMPDSVREKRSRKNRGVVAPSATKEAEDAPKDITQEKPTEKDLEGNVEETQAIDGLQMNEDGEKEAAEEQPKEEGEAKGAEEEKKEEEEEKKDDEEEKKEDEKKDEEEEKKYK